MFSIILMLIPAFWALAAELPTDGPTLRIPQGLIQGTYKKSYKNRTFSAFEGIPYALPPVGDLRFEAPKPAAGWNDTLKANRHYECAHFLPFPIVYGPRGTEDCLYTYVYVPRETIDPNELLDVVVHIHGGGFMLGAPKYMVGPEFLMDRDIVVVSFNYRLGILGFLSTEDAVVPGNNGLKDQSLALLWIKNNIKYFGGNPDSITLTGVSAGGASVHFHYFSPLSRGLFHRGLSQSGTALQCWSLAENPLEKAKTVAKNVSCPTSSTEQMVECLRKVEATKLISGIKVLFVYLDAVPIAPFAPVVERHSETAFLRENPYKMLKDGNVYDVPWITSNTKDEGLLPVGLLVAYKKLGELDQKWYEIMQYLLEIRYTVEPSLQKQVLGQIKEYYFKGKPLSLENVYSFVKLINDRMFLVDTEKAIRMQAEATKSNVYYYLFSYMVDMPHVPPIIPKGAVHGDDCRLMFKMLFTPPILSKNDEKMMEYFIDFIVTFAKKGVPKFSSVEWSPVTPDADSKIDFLQIGGPTAISMKSVERLAPNDFWDSLPIKEGEKYGVSGSPRIEHGVYLVIITITTVFNY